MNRKQMGWSAVCIAALLITALAASGCGKGKDEKAPPPASPGSATKLGLADLAPKDTFAIVLMDYKAIAATGVVEKSTHLKKLAQSQPLPLPLAKVDELAIFFVMDPAKADEGAAACGVVKHREANAAVEGTLKKQQIGPPQVVAGKAAYTAAGNTCYACVDETTLVFGKDTATLAEMVKIVKAGKGEPSPALRSAVSGHPGAQIRAALAPSRQMKDNLLKNLPMKNPPKYVPDAEHVGAGLTIRETAFTLDAAVVFGSPGSTEQACKEGNDYLSSSRTEVVRQTEELEKSGKAGPATMMMKTYLEVLNTMKFASRGNELTFTMNASLDQLEQLVSLFALTAAAQAGAMQRTRGTPARATEQPPAGEGAAEGPPEGGGKTGTEETTK